MVRIGLDVGGTFTDVFLVDDSTGLTFQHKLSSTPEAPHEAPVRGISEILRLAGGVAADVKFVGLGTTVATNALIQRRGGLTGLITTAGFRDLLEIGRQTRPKVFGLIQTRPAPLVPRYLRLEVDERMAADGEIIRPLDDAAVAACTRALRAQGVAAIAVCFLHAYANPAHEEEAVRIIRDIWPEVAVAPSQILVPEFREFERLSSVVVNAYLMPVMARYVETFRDAVRALGISVDPVVMNSAGGVFTIDIAAVRPVDTLLSGPSGGVSAALVLGQAIGRDDLITFDMGGTSTDVCLIADGQAESMSMRTIDGMPIRSASVGVHAVGAGGSSIAWLDAGGLLNVGPQSAGAAPGPACYLEGGTEPTVTDANVVLGRLNPLHLLGGALPIDATKGAACILQRIAAPKSLGLEAAAAAILAIAVNNVAEAIRYVSVQRGLDPSGYTLVAFGGAGPLHAADIARELDMDVVVPLGPGVFCAAGVLEKDLLVSLRRTRILQQDDPRLDAEAEAAFAALRREAKAMLPTGSLLFERSIEMRYVGQNFEIAVAVESDERNAAWCEKFHALHKKLYGYDQPSKKIELVTFCLQARQPRDAATAVAPPPMQRTGKLAPREQRTVYFEATGFSDCPVFARGDMIAGDRLSGPAVIEQMDTTTILPPGCHLQVDTGLRLHLSWRPK